MDKNYRGGRSCLEKLQNSLCFHSYFWFHNIKKKKVQSHAIQEASIK